MSVSVLKLVAPLSGPVVAIESVPDPVFSQKLVGNGVAIDPISQVLLAPCPGRVAMLHSSCHAITIATESGVQVLMHIGLDTVQLKGKGFRARVKAGDQVKAGQPLIEFSADEIALAGKPLMTMMVVTGETPLQILPVAFASAGKETLIEVRSATQTSANGSEKVLTAESREVRTTLPTGMHARPAALMVNLAKSFTSNIEVITERGAANAKSVVGVMGLEIGNGEKVHFFAEGEDAQAAVGALAHFIENLREEAAHEPTAMVKPKASTDKNVLVGVGVSPGLAIGRITRLQSARFEIHENAFAPADAEKAELQFAIHTAISDLTTLRAQMKEKIDASQAAIFSAHAELLEDPTILDLANALVDQGKSAAFAWNEAITVHADRLAHLNNELMANRANDLMDVGQRVLRILLPAATTSGAPAFKSESILIAENLTPSQTAQLDREKVFAFATVTGGATSHVAILARSLGLPALAGMEAKILEIPEGTEVIVDGDRGELCLNPTTDEKAKIVEKQKEQLERRKAALQMSQKPALTRDGKRIEVAANIGNLGDAKEAMEMGADGVGLLRSEFLFLERETAPSEDEQHAIYQQIADVLGDKPLVIRTLDVGGDKPLQYLPIGPEENPFLGIRGIRVGLLHQDILRTQLRAILRVQSKAKIHIMFPMIATLEEFHQARAILEEERAKLGAKAVAAGIMVEVPSVALNAEAFAKEVDFFSVGTNDLTQYTLAMDRGHKELAKQADALHPSVLKLIELTCQAAQKYNRWVGVCGGLAGDNKAVGILIGLGVTELSVSIPSVPLIKSRVRENAMPEAKALAVQALAASTADGVRALTTKEENKKTKGFANAASENVVLVPAENR